MPPKKGKSHSKKEAGQQTDAFLDTFAKLRAILKKYEPHLTLKIDKPGEYYLDCAYSDRWKKVLLFAAAHVKKNYVSFYFMPIYMSSELQSTLSPELKRRMQGKACFNFKSIEPSQIKELAQLTKKGFDRWKKEGFI